MIEGQTVMVTRTITETFVGRLEKAGEKSSGDPRRHNDWAVVVPPTPEQPRGGKWVRLHIGEDEWYGSVSQDAIINDTVEVVE